MKTRHIDFQIFINELKLKKIKTHVCQRELNFKMSIIILLIDSGCAYFFENVGDLFVVDCGSQ